jgi:protein involved in polysaccharide export with SLBB domain
MDRNVSIFARLSLIASAFALLAFSAWPAHAQSAPVQPTQAAQPQGFGYVPVQGVDTQQPYGIKPIPGYTPPPQQQAPMGPPQYGYAPLPQTNYAPPAQQPVMRPASNDYGYNGTMYGTQLPNDPQAYYQAPGAVNAGYTLGAGDKIRVTVFGETDISGEYQVDGSGMVRLPLIGTLRAAGYTAPGLEQWITSALAAGYLKSPRVNVEITIYRPFYIIGAVNHPGQYPYVDHMSALNAVALGGGFTDQAITGTVYVRHEGETQETEMETAEVTHILPGDVIRVKTSVFWQAMNMIAPIAGPAAIAATVLH